MQFLEGIGKIANMTNTTPPEGIGLWYESFKHWSLKDWHAACDCCAVEMKWFPKAADIKERKPKNYSTGAVEKASGWMMESENLNQRGTEELETEIDSLSNSDLEWLFTNYGAPVGAKWLVQRFRDNPNGALYRGFIRDALKERNAKN